MREVRELVAGTELTPWVRSAMAADFTNPLANSGDKGLEFVNADYTLYLHRLPVGEWIGVEATSHHSVEGVAVATCALYDEDGPIGRSAVGSIANRR
jgi:acyl-CoA thioesterase